ncbi:FtsX-like permease family protein [Nonomuraea sp. NEAU-A123]|uniref:ABC transporter permease n=1 Tax=Nonomuraea sp. NEAU-A123 TaxID=2839649 RepID=UPI001BE44749|nr:FtsX-like permease family protein [Nonomuraea sp. NEAU-A123]MBT2235724.1 FtsX-like permease family protein [Nonomuraea sp. NEAU-A123]
MSAFAAALRISRRDALRFKGRTALIMVMIGLPVLLITGVLTGAATIDVNDREGLTAELGTADARIATTRYRLTIEQDASGRGWTSAAGEPFTAPPWTRAGLAALVDGRIIPCDEGSVEVPGKDGYDLVWAVEVDLRDPMTRGMRSLKEGRFPAAPGEVVVTPAMLERGAKVGDAISVTRRNTPVRVVGVIEHPNRPTVTEIIGLQGVLLPDKTDGSGTGWLADTAAPFDWAHVRGLNGHGLLVQSRAIIENLPDGVLYSSADVLLPIKIALTVVFIVIETALLAGPAFAVGLRRRRRELAVIAAQGGSGTHLRAIVLADGLVLGGVAALAGTVLGVGSSLAVAPLVGQWLGSLGPIEVPWASVAGVAVLGVVSGLIAALVPAVQAARQRPAQVLAGREGEFRDRAGRPVLGLVLVVAGLVVTALSLRSDGLPVVAALGLVVLGLVALMPWLVRRTARLAARLPLPLRLAVRDASRHRSRTASAAAAVMAATVAAVGFSIGLASSSAGREAAYHPYAPIGSLKIEGADLDDSGWAKLRVATAGRLGGAQTVPAAYPVDTKGRRVWIDLGRNCGERCDDQMAYGGEVPVGDAQLLALIQGRQDPQAAAALAAGKIVVFDPQLIKNGLATLQFDMGDEGSETRTKQVPAVLVSAADPRLSGGVVPPAALTSVGVQVKERRLYAMYRPADQERLTRDLSAISGRVDLYAERGRGNDLTVVLWILLGVAMVLVLGGTFAATGLAAADMRRDLDTMSAVGAPSRSRRLVIAGQAGYIAGLGAVVGVVAGAVAGIALSWPMAVGRQRGGEAFPFDPGPTTVAVPWLFLVALVLGLPLLAALVAGLSARTRLVLARRLT